MGEGAFLVQKIKTKYQKLTTFPNKFTLNANASPSPRVSHQLLGNPGYLKEQPGPVHLWFARAIPSRAASSTTAHPTHVATAQASLEETIYPGTTPTRNLEASSFPAFQESSPNSDRTKQPHLSVRELQFLISASPL